MALDKESLKCLEEVKQGKSRKFAMICVGREIVSLYVFKIGDPKKYKELAKKEGKKGKFFHGVITNKGQKKLDFQLAEGFSKAPGTDKKLKAYLKAESGIEFKPMFAIAETTDSADEKKLQAALKKLTPLVKTAVQNAPDRKADIMGAVARIQEALNSGNLEEARQELATLGQLIKELPAGKPAVGDGDSGETRRWAAAKKNWTANKKKQVEAIKETMNILGNLALDEEMDAKQVDAFIKELATYVPSYQRCAKGLDAALEGIDEPMEPPVRSAAFKKLDAAIKDMEKFYTGPKIQKILDDFDGKDFFDPTHESLVEMSELVS